MNQESIVLDNLHDFPLAGSELIVTLTILVLLILGVSLAYWRHRFLFTVMGVLGLIASLIPLGFLPDPAPDFYYLSNLFVWDRLTLFFKLFFVVVGAVTLALSFGSKEIDDAEYNEYAILVLSVTLGMMLLAGAKDLLMIYIAFETMSILSFLLVGIKPNDLRSGEAALKYVLYSAFTSGIMLFGFSLLFGLTGSTDLVEMSGRMVLAGQEPQNRLLIVLAVLFFVAGLLFKTASFPFHFWCPDVYEGAPTPIAAFLSVGPKAAGFVLFIRLFFPLFSKAGGTEHFEVVGGIEWPQMLVWVSAATMTLGNLAALPQTNLKRLLAYSSIAHAGYLLMGVAVITDLGLRAVIFYLVVYLFMNLGAFSVVAMVSDAGGTEDMESYRGLGSKSAFLCVAMTVFLFSLIGIPPFAGFVGKVYLFAAVISKKIYWLAVVAAVNTVISLYYYLRIVKAMFLEQATQPFMPSVSPASHAILIVLLVPTLLFGLYWGPLADAVRLMF